VVHNPPVAAPSRPNTIRGRARRCRAGESLLLPMPVHARRRPDLRDTAAHHERGHGPCSWTRGSRDGALEPVGNATRSGVIISTPVFMRTMIDHPAFGATKPLVGNACSRLGGAGGSAGNGARRCKRSSAAGASAPTARRSTRLSRPAGFGDELERDATTDGPLIGAAELRVVDPKTLDDHAARNSRRAPRPAGPEMFRRLSSTASLDVDAFVEDGWFRTGDLAVYDGEYLTIVDPPQGHHHPRR